MDSLTLEQKQAQFNEFFLIGHALKVNVRTLASDFVLPEPEQLEEHMPYAFRIASEMSAIETQALRPLRNLSSHASDLVNYLTHQSRKIDLMMSYILHQQDDPNYRTESIRFGGGGVVINHDSELAVGTIAELKLFVTEEAAAVFLLWRSYCLPARAEWLPYSLHFYPNSRTGSGVIGASQPALTNAAT